MICTVKSDIVLNCVSLLDFFLNSASFFYIKNLYNFSKRCDLRTVSLARDLSPFVS
jgi:hypothetical protein